MTTREGLLVVGSWLRGRDGLSRIPRKAGLAVRKNSDDAEMALVSGSMEGAVAARRAAGNVPYVARYRGRPAAYVWVATTIGHVPSLGLSFELPSTDRLIWDMTVVESGSEPGLCSQLLQEVIEREKAERYWIVAKPGEAAEIDRAGFTLAADLYRSDGAACIECENSPERAQALAEVVGMEMPQRQRASAVA
jgi:hypothetical protein